LARREADSYKHIVSEDCLTKAIYPLQHTARTWITEQGTGVYRAHFKVILVSVGSMLCMTLLCEWHWP